MAFDHQVGSEWKVPHQAAWSLERRASGGFGIGRATALLFARQGAKLVVTARPQSELDKLIAQIEQDGGVAIAVAGDVKDEAHAKRAVEATASNFGGLDIAFNNAALRA